MALAEIRGYQRGDVADYTNDTDTKIPAMTILSVGDSTWIAAGDIEPGQLGAAYVTGAFFMPKKASEAIDQGKRVFWTGDGITAEGTAAAAEGDETSSAVTTTTAAGVALAAASATDTHVLVRLG